METKQQFKLGQKFQAKKVFAEKVSTLLICTVLSLSGLCSELLAKQYSLSDLFNIRSEWSVAGYRVYLV